MSTVLCLSSQVARGFVGGSATRIALQRMQHECWLLPTVILSNHPAHARFAGEQVPIGRLRAMLEAMDANGWLEEVDAVVAGYMPSPEHVGFAGQLFEFVGKRNPEVLRVCDPILGDDPGGLYIDDDSANAVREELVPSADILTPNRFELEWLTGSAAKRTKTATAAARDLAPRTVLVTSVTGTDVGSLVNLLVDEKTVTATTVPRRKDAPHGSGDLMSALFLGEVLNGRSTQDALGAATGRVQAALELSGGSDELRLVTAPDWFETEPWPVETPQSK
ncbi:MAG: pyridoxal kinase [Hyphomicrobiaceae bacterium]|nr:pyridoxal kinase [Hyphomicrobiaceae bacterium]